MPEKQFKEIKEVMESHINDFLDRTVLLGSLYIPGVKEILEPIYLQDEELTVFVRECLAFDSTLQKRTEELERKFLKPLV